MSTASPGSPLPARRRYEDIAVLIPAWQPDAALLPGPVPVWPLPLRAAWLPEPCGTTRVLCVIPSISLFQFRHYDQFRGGLFK